jgi:multicomponent Na+:H+ antiporter subunit G
MSDYITYAAYTLISVGVLCNVVAAVALLRFPDVYTRLMTSTKFITGGTTSILFGVAMIFGFSAIGAKALLCLALIILTSPIESHVLMRASKKSGVPQWKADSSNPKANK